MGTILLDRMKRDAILPVTMHVVKQTSLFLPRDINEPKMKSVMSKMKSDGMLILRAGFLFGQTLNDLVLTNDEPMPPAPARQLRAILRATAKTTQEHVTVLAQQSIATTVQTQAPSTEQPALAQQSPTPTAQPHTTQTQIAKRNKL